jgi:hypothetical protein
VMYLGSTDLRAFIVLVALYVFQYLKESNCIAIADRRIKDQDWPQGMTYLFS